MSRKLGVIFVSLALTVMVASPALAQSSLGDSIENLTNSLIERTFSDVFGSPSQSQYDRPGDDGPANGDVVLPAAATQSLCNSVVQNNAVPFFIQTEIAESFELDCEPSGSFLDSFFDGFPFYDGFPF